MTHELRTRIKDNNNDRRSLGIKPATKKPNKRRWFTAALLAGCTLVAHGCTRTYHRTRADIETGVIIADKVDTAGMPTIRNIQVDRASRMFDPFNPDRPPMPEDDPVSHRYMQFVDGKKHYPLWYVNGRTNLAESPDWWQYLPLDERGVLVLDIDTSVRLALLHAPDYQRALETLYLSALDVSSERFLLDNQYFAGYGAGVTTTGPGRRTNNGQSSTLVTTGFNQSRGARPLGFQRAFTTGATFAAGLANSLTWQVAGPDTQTANTVLDFSLFQPLLRGAGRDRVMETLTLAERTLLSNVRAYERYRVGFALSISVGRADETGPTRRGGLFGGAGLQGFTGLGGGFGAVTSNLTGGGGGGFAAAATVPQAGGYLGLLQDKVQIQNTLDNTQRLRQVLFQFEDQLSELLLKIPTGQADIPQQELQVAQTRQSLITAQNSLLNLQSQYETSLDTFKADMGLPPYICVEIKDPMLDQFYVVSQEMLQRGTQVSDLRASVGINNSNLLKMSEIVTDEDSGNYRILNINDGVRDELAKLLSNDKKIKLILDNLFEADLPMIRADIKHLEETIGPRKEQLARLRRILNEERDAICSILPAKGLDAALFSDSELEKLPGIVSVELERIEQRLKKYLEEYYQLLENIEQIATENTAPPLAQPDDKLPAENKGRAQFESIRDSAILKSQELLAAISDDILAMQVLQARVRTESVLLPVVDIDQRQAIDIARANRLDWMNTRASLVDQWRSIEVVADQLEAYLDVTFSGDVLNRNDNPFSLANNTGRLQAGLQWDSPLTRLQERNQYRQVLIEYQQAKRTYYTFEDNVWRTLRSELRSVRLSQLNFELQRYAVRIAAQQITLNTDIRSINESLQVPQSNTAARDVIQALQALLDAQNTLIGVWANYELQRRNLNQDLGTARVDGEGVWVDPGPITTETVVSGGMLDGGMVEGTPFDVEPVAPDAATGEEGQEPEVLPDVSVAPNVPAEGVAPPGAVQPVEPPAVQ